MRILIPVFAFLALLTGTAEAANRCSLIPDGPAIGAPVYQLFAGDVHLTIWRDGPFVTSLITPLEESSGTPTGTLTQGDATAPAGFVGGYQFILGSCVPGGITLTQPTAYDIISGGPIAAGFVDVSKTFTLTVNGASVVIPEQPRGVTLEINGCSPCVAGEVAAFHALITNPFPPTQVDVRAVIVFPDGTVWGWRSTTVEVPTGSLSVQLPPIIVPASVPSGVYTLQAAILDPLTGATLAKGVVRVAKE